MKELEDKSQDKEIAVHAQQKKLKVIGQMQVVKGLTLWEFNPETNQIAKAQFTETYDVKKKEKVKSVIAKKDCSYCQALNLKNAVKKFSREGLR